MTKGNCNCGAVTFEITTEISDVYICHCSICRKSTGSGGIAVLVIANDDFHWLTGTKLINTWHKPGHDWQTSFCKNCGSPLPGANDDARMHVPAGLISEGGKNLKVAHHLWVDSKAPWEEIGTSGKKHPESFQG
ncbi:GFA family protein [Thalassomonas viridans]|uniref:GFA family protein n=1 Tax=Thalassomonas viridans TaxID=137584 RepID=A0AAE9YYH2_9GAMM|nr:GFA family protein [Thalassomonas viridans]WDE02750.1 GFA family protein [Thalassomonas viridans]